LKTIIEEEVVETTPDGKIIKHVATIVLERKRKLLEITQDKAKKEFSTVKRGKRSKLCFEDASASDLLSVGQVLNLRELIIRDTVLPILSHDNIRAVLKYIIFPITRYRLKHYIIIIFGTDGVSNCELDSFVSHASTTQRGLLRDFRKSISNLSDEVKTFKKHPNTLLYENIKRWMMSKTCTNNRIATTIWEKYQHGLIRYCKDETVAKIFFVPTHTKLVTDAQRAVVFLCLSLESENLAAEDSISEFEQFTCDDDIHAEERSKFLELSYPESKTVMQFRSDDEP